MNDYIELGTIVPLEDGWYFDKETNVRFRIDEDGKPVDEWGDHLLEYEEDEEEEYERN